MLGTLESRLDALLAYLVRVAPGDPITKRMEQRWGRRRKLELLDARSTDQAAITVDKKTIYMCLEDKETRALHDIEHATFVLLHELSHMVSPTIGHPGRFWKNMGYVLGAASCAPWGDGGTVYKDQQFEKLHSLNRTVVYCGHPITSAPPFKRTCPGRGGTPAGPAQRESGSPTKRK